MLNVYCIPGMGVDERIFQNLSLNNCTIRHIKWITPLINESLPDYAMRLAKQIDTSQPFILIGVSFGGMCCTEITRRLNPLKTILISSCKASDELPLKIHAFKLFPLYKIWNDKLFIYGALLLRKNFGVLTKEYTELFRRMLKTAPVNYFKRAVHCIVFWKNKPAHKNIIHIHGTADKILPFRKIKNCDYTINNGTHWMVMDRADEISKIINGELKKLSI